MKTVILAGGLGTRLAEETVIRPKPMVEIGGKPMLWHIMNIYSAAGFNEFVLALGYKGEVIKDYFLNYHSRNNNIRVDLQLGKATVYEGAKSNWIIDLVDTGSQTQTGGRIKRLCPWLGDERFFATYGDGVADIDIKQLLAFHCSHGRLATVTAVRPPSRYGDIVLEGEQVSRFAEKSQTGEGWINGGFFVLEPGIFQYISDDDSVFERDPMDALVRDGQLMAYRHDGFWQAMDTLRERNYLEELWRCNQAPWRIWTDNN